MFAKIVDEKVPLTLRKSLAWGLLRNVQPIGNGTSTDFDEVSHFQRVVQAARNVAKQEELCCVLIRGLNGNINQDDKPPSPGGKRHYSHSPSSFAPVRRSRFNLRSSTRRCKVLGVCGG